MTGRILGYDIDDNTGIISADNGERYKFSKEDWKDSIVPEKEMKVDFEAGDKNLAKDIYLVKDQTVENTSAWLGLVAVLITFLFGFIGTFVSRLVIAKQPIGGVLVSTATHFVITFLILIPLLILSPLLGPLLGLLIYMVGTLYYMYKNFMLVTKPNQYS